MVGWIARLLLIAAGTVTGWFVARDEPNFGVIQLATAPLLLTFVVAVLAFRPARWTVRYRQPTGLAQGPNGAPEGQVSGSGIETGMDQGGRHDAP